MDNLFWYHLGKKRGGGGETEAPVLPLNMTSGDQIVTPSEGKLLSQVTIEKPDTLIPENIAEGIDIAGITGTLAAGGTSAIQHFSKSVSLSFSKSSSQQTNIVLPAAELPDWWPAAGSMLAHAYNKQRPIYIAILVRTSGTTGSQYLESAMLTNYTNNDSSPGLGCYFGATSTSSPAPITSVANYWNYTPSSYNGLFQNASGIYIASYNSYNACKGTYKLTLLKIDPYSA